MKKKIYIYTHIHTYIIYIHTYMCTFIHIYVCTCLYIDTYQYARTHVYIYTYIRTHTLVYILVLYSQPYRCHISHLVLSNTVRACVCVCFSTSWCSSPLRLLSEANCTKITVCTVNCRYYAFFAWAEWSSCMLRGLLFLSKTTE